MPVLAGAPIHPLPQPLTATAAFGDRFPGVRTGDYVALFDSGSLLRVPIERVSATYLVVERVRYLRSSGFVVHRNADGSHNWAPMSVRNAGLPNGPAYIEPWGPQQEALLGRWRLSHALHKATNALLGRVEILAGSVGRYQIAAVAEVHEEEARRLLQILTDAMG